MSDFINESSKSDQVSEVSIEQLCSWARSGDSDSLRSHLDKAFTLNTLDNEGDSLLMLACRHGHVDVCELLISFGAEVNVANADGKTPLMFAAMFNRKLVVDLLLENGADAYAKSADGLTALGIARAMGAEATSNRLAQHVELF